MNLRLAGTIGTFLLIVLGLMYQVGEFTVKEFAIFLGLGAIAGLIAWFKLFKPSSQRDSN